MAEPIPFRATPRPWRDAQTMGAIVSDDPSAIAARGPENFRGYGGAIVCESAEKPDRKLIVRAVNEYQALLGAEANLRAIVDLLTGAYQTHAREVLDTLDAVRRAS